MKIGTAIRDGVKLVTSGSVQMMLGGIVAAVVPANVGIPYKEASYIGSMIMAAYAGEKMNDFIDEKLDGAAEMLDIVGDCYNTLKEEIHETEPEEG